MALADMSPEELRARTKVIMSKLRDVHGARYIYGSEPFGQRYEKILVTCRIHGGTLMFLGNHLQGRGFLHCARVNRARSRRKEARERFKIKIVEIHGDRYDFSLTRYVDSSTSVVVVCRLHGEFLIPTVTLLIGRGCTKCGIESASLLNTSSQEHILSRYRIRHGDEYDYSLVIYRGRREKVTVICRQHGPFEIISGNHSTGGGCAKCGFKKIAATHRFTIPELEARLEEVHGDRFSYDLSGYKSQRTKILITCKEHGEFRQGAGTHLLGSACPQCSSSHGEANVAVSLKSAGINFIPQFMHETCRGKGARLRFDFAIPSQNILIEFDGVQHREPVRWTYLVTQEQAEDQFRYRQRLDGIKTDWAAANGWRLIRLIDPKTVEADLIEHGVIPALELAAA